MILSLQNNQFKIIFAKVMIQDQHAKVDQSLLDCINVHAGVGLHCLYILFNTFLLVDASVGQQTTFENILAKGAIANNKYFLLLPICFFNYIHSLHFHLKRFLTFFPKMFSKSFTADMLNVGKGFMPQVQEDKRNGIDFQFFSQDAVVLLYLQ